MKNKKKQPFRGKGGASRKGGGKPGFKGGFKSGFKSGSRPEYRDRPADDRDGDRRSGRDSRNDRQNDGRPAKDRKFKGGKSHSQKRDYDRPEGFKGKPRRDDKSGFKPRPQHGRQDAEREPRREKAEYRNRPNKGGEFKSDRFSKFKGAKDANAPAFLYGLHAMEAAWINPQRKFKKLWLTQQGAENFSAAMAIARKKGLDRPEPQIVERHILDNRLPSGAVHQGIAAEVAPLDEVFLSDILVAAHKEEKITLVMLDQVTDPHNVGAVLRSCAAFGAKALILQKRYAPEITGVLAKTASGAVEHVPIIREVNLSRALEELKENGFACVGLDEHSGTSLADLPKSQKTVLVLGAEGAGIRHLVGQTCTQLVRLPTGGPIASLNVSNAAAVALYEVSKP